MVAPAATRNSDALCDLLVQNGPSSGRALEIASGTGQHVSAFARRLPSLHWQPTEIDQARRKSINTYAADLPNVADAINLDATVKGWHKDVGTQDLIVLINLVHLISWAETQSVTSEVAQALAPKGRFVLYGPFKRSGDLTSEGDRRFHEALIQQDAEIGYKNDDDIAGLLTSYNLTVANVVEMPANNLAFVAEKPEI